MLGGSGYTHVCAHTHTNTHAQGVVLFPSTVCKYVAVELKSAFEETGKTKEVIDTGYGILDRKASGVKYTKS